LGEPERVTAERKQLNQTLDTLKNAIKVLQRDPDITNTAFDDDELSNELRLETQKKGREDDRQRRNPPPNGERNPNMNGGP
jgi:hypothetical protein